MTARDRLVMAIVAAVVIVGIAYIGVVKPERKKVTGLDAQIATQQASIAKAQAQAVQTAATVRNYRKDVILVKQLALAVPSGDGIPALMQTLSAVSKSNHVSFQVISVSGSSSSSPSSAAAGATGASGAAGSAFTPISFSFTFGGNYVNLQHFLRELTNFITVDPTGVHAIGRLLSIQSVQLSPPSSSTRGGAVGSTSASVTATAYTAASSSTSTTATTGAPSPTPTTSPATPSGAAAAAGHAAS